MSSHATLSAAADDRKARLAKLKSLKRKQPEENEGEDSHDHHEDQTLTTATSSDQQQQQSPPSPPTKDISHLHLSGRNYDPETRGPKLGFEAPPTLALDKPTLEEQAADIEDELRRKEAEDAQEEKGIDLFKLQPKKPNWDLKRELNQRLEVLNVQTDNAIAKLVRERLEAKKLEAAAVASASGKDVKGDGEVEEAGLLEGPALMEGMRLREKEEAEEQRRERELEDAELA